MRLAARVAAVLSLVACSPVQKPALSVQEVCERIRTAALEFQARCRPNWFSSPSDSTPGFPSCNPDVVPAAQAGLNAGRLEIDLAKVDACVADYHVLGCLLPPEVYSCDAPFIARVNAPGDCYIDAECASKQCILTNNCPGVCKELEKPIELKSTDWCNTYYSGDLCPAGSYCSAPNGSPACSSRPPTPWCHCVARGNVGEPCSRYSASECLEDLVCNGTSCMPPGKVGEPCLGVLGCERGLTCLFSDLKTGVCGEPRAEGEDCLSYSDCAPELTCRGPDLTGKPPITGKCAPYGGLNEACHSREDFFEHPDCSIGLACNDGICQKRPVAGEPCGGNLECVGESVYCIHSDEGATCRIVPPPAAGENCRFGSQCDPLAFCDGYPNPEPWKCAAKRNAGDACDISNQCLSGSCAFNHPICFVQPCGQCAEPAEHCAPPPETDPQ